ncbi:MAG: hypothetical protein QXD55_01240 [Candidatus Aenigmatarchaeota archaeon]
MERFKTVSPLDYRYIPQDKELVQKLKEYENLDILTKLSKAVPEISLPRLYLLEEELRNIANKNKYVVIPKRVNGRHKGKITIEKVFNQYANRLNKRIKNIENISLNFKELEESERNEEISDLTYFHISALSVEANIATDIRHQFRSEIKEYAHKKFWETERIGSSTMVHKENPAEYEQVASLWKAFMPNTVSAVLAQITEHQGDSTNEYLPDMAFQVVCGTSIVTKNLIDNLKNLKINV